ncbi:MAG TPA: pirin family protein [Bacteroidales bacterium]|nr:pirin family protein [Bacteroidales bacterium]
MKTVYHKASSRGHASHGWLDTWHSFSFADYYDPERIRFGVLRVLNDDTVAPGMGFGQHPHENMEIISIPLSGDLEHRDSMGNTQVIRQGDVQVMSAGSGIYHSEKNKNRDQEVKFLQIWVIPNKQNVEPRYDQITLDKTIKNQWRQIVSPNPDDEGVWIYQKAWFSLLEAEKDATVDYPLKKEGNGIYIFLLEGNISAGPQKMEKRDGLGIWDITEIKMDVHEDSRLLLMEVPMDI